jgi:hypothetical protein
MNVWVVYEDSGAYSDWDRYVAAVFSSRESADEFARRKNEARSKVQRGLYGTSWESSGDDFWIVDAATLTPEEGEAHE